jgi:hypothetical protein
VTCTQIFGTLHFDETGSGAFKLKGTVTVFIKVLGVDGS